MIIGEVTIFQVEERTMLEGLHLTWDKEFRKLELECDNGLLVETILAGGAADSRRTELRWLHSMLIRSWKVCVRRIPRVQNTVVDQLTKLINLEFMRFNLMKSPSSSIKELLMVYSNLSSLN